MRNLKSFAVVLMAALMPGITLAADKECDRSCLQSLTEQYLKAVVAHDVKAAPLMTGYRQTENAKVKRVGTGVWQMVTGLDNEARFYLDPVAGQALWFGVINTTMRDKPEVAMVRLKVINREIAEAEWYMSGPGLGSMQGPAQADGTNEIMSDTANLRANKPPVRSVPMAARLPRAALEGIANSYFDGLTENDGSLVLAHPDCFRLENGVKVTGRPLTDGKTDGYQGKTNCASNFGNFNISLVSHRRFFAVDEEQQVAATSAIFMRNADGVERRCVFIEIFYVDKEAISQIYSVIYYPDPNDPVPNWEPYFGNFPLPESFGKAK
jgi:hypothetical protein